MKAAIRALALLAALGAAFSLASCKVSFDKGESSSSASSTGQAAPNPPGEGPVEGTLRGHRVVLDEATYDGQLSIHAEGSWAAGPSLLIFFFLDEGEEPWNRIFTVDADAGVQSGNPHVHYRWPSHEGTGLDVEAVVSGYDLRLEIGAPEDGQVTGNITFAVPDEETRVSGSFRAVVED